MTIKTRTTCPYCGVGCGIIASRLKQGDIHIQGDPEHSANYGRLCSKGSALAETIDLDGRLLYPEIKQQRVSWDQALDKVATSLSNTIRDYGPDSVAFYVSGQLLTEDYYVANKLMKGFIGTANIDTNSRLCMSSAVAGHKRAFGSDTVPCDYRDLEQADLIVLAGSNLAWCHPVIYQRIVQIKKQRPALKVVVIDPVKTATCDIADLHLAIKPGSDVMLFNGLLNHMQREGVLNWDYLEQHIDGFAATIQICQQTAGSIPVVAQYCNLPERDIAEFYRLFTKTEKTVSVYSQGINQSSSGTDKVNAIINCHLVTGRIGQTGMGPFSMTGQPNAMGGREVGGLSNQLAAHMDLENIAHRETVKHFWGSPYIADKPGLKAVDLFNAVYSGDIKVIWVMGTNPTVSLPNADHVFEALEKCEHVIVSDCIRETDTTEKADILLPALTWGEKNGTVTNSERCISRQRPFLSPPGEAKADWWIISEVAKRMGYSEWFNYQHPAELFREHAELSAFHNNGKRDFDLSDLCKINEKGYDDFKPIQWPVRESKPKKRFFADGQFFHANGKARMIAVEPRAPVNLPDNGYPLILNTGRVRDHWHTLTRTGKSARLSSHSSEPSIALHPEDAIQYQLHDKSLVKVKSKWGEMIARCNISIHQQKGCVFVPMHWNKQFASNGRVDALVNPAVDPYSGQPESKHTPVMVKPAELSWQGFYISRNVQSINTDYWVRSTGKELNRYQIAGSNELDWSSWAKELMMENDVDWLEYSDESVGRYRAAVVKQGQLMSCLFIAPSYEQLPDKSWLENLFLEESLDKIERACLLAGKPAKGEDNQGPTVCSCFGVGRNTIINTILKYDLRNVEGIGRYLQAGTNCGSCVSELKEILVEIPKAVANA